MGRAEFWIITNVGEKITHAVFQRKVLENPPAYDVYYNYSDASEILGSVEIQSQIKKFGVDMYICPLHDTEED